MTAGRHRSHFRVSTRLPRSISAGVSSEAVRVVRGQRFVRPILYVARRSASVKGTGSGTSPAENRRRQKGLPFPAKWWPSAHDRRPGLIPTRRSRGEPSVTTSRSAGKRGPYLNNILGTSLARDALTANNDRTLARQG